MSEENLIWKVKIKNTIGINSNDRFKLLGLLALIERKKITSLLRKTFGTESLE